ncbi:MAG TPA: hypothetical protein VF657_00600 [Actinoplanes sp.]
MVEWLDVGDKIAAVVAGLLGIASLAYTVRGTREAAQRSEEVRQRAGSAMASAIRYTADNLGQETWDRLKEQVDEPATRRISRIAEALHESQLLISELQSEMDTKVAAVERLRAEEEESRRLASLREEEARAVRNLVSATIESAHRELQRSMEQERDEQQGRLLDLQDALKSMQESGRKDQARFFLYGVGVSIPIGIVINIFF